MFGGHECLSNACFVKKAKNDPKVPCSFILEMFSGCIIEEDISYDGNDIIDKVMESQQDCADFSKTIMGGNFWTWNSGDKRCWVKTTSAGWRSKGGRVSGNRACGSGEKCVPMCSYVLAIYVNKVNILQPIFNQPVCPALPPTPGQPCDVAPAGAQDCHYAGDHCCCGRCFSSFVFSCVLDVQTGKSTWQTTMCPLEGCSSNGEF